jgi:hypothetical protein
MMLRSLTILGVDSCLEAPHVRDALQKEAALTKLLNAPETPQGGVTTAAPAENVGGK